MTKRKLQIFLSSTYEDLIEHRLAAMEAILAAGHIPAAMEQFSAGDETAWEKIQAWIDESDAFILILGGRYGSIEPQSGKSYVELEYEYAVGCKKPLFALVVSDEHHEDRVKQHGLVVDERKHHSKYEQFKRVVTLRLCKFWNDKKDIQAAIFQKLPEWAHQPGFTGWVRGDEAATPQVMNELARLSDENRELRSQVSRLEIFSNRHDLSGDATFKEALGRFNHLDIIALSAEVAISVFREALYSALERKDFSCRCVLYDPSPATALHYDALCSQVLKLPPKSKREQAKQVFSLASRRFQVKVISNKPLLYNLWIATTKPDLAGIAHISVYSYDAQRGGPAFRVADSNAPLFKELQNEFDYVWKRVAKKIRDVHTRRHHATGV